MRLKKIAFQTTCLLAAVSILGSTPAHAAESSAELTLEVQQLSQRLNALAKAVAEQGKRHERPSVHTSSPDLAAQVLELTQKVNALSTAVAEQAAAPKRQVVYISQVVPQKSAAVPFAPPLYPYSPGLTSPLTVGNSTVSLTPYGIISLGLMNISNSGGKQFNGWVNGPMNPPRLGVRVYWNLGDKTSVVAVLEMGYSILNGTLGQGTRIFGRQEYIGLHNIDYGTVTIGRQYDDVVQNTDFAESSVIFAANGAHIGDSDDMFNTLRLNNDIRYASPYFHHMSFSASYAFSQSDEQGNNNAYSAGLQYDARKGSQGLRLGAAFLVLNTPNSATNASGAIDNDTYGYSSPFVSSPVNHAGVASQRADVISGSYGAGPFTYAADYSNVQFNYQDKTSLNLQNAEVTLAYFPIPKLLTAAAFIYTWGRYTDGAKPNYEQVNLGADYFINPHLDFFLVDNFQVAGGSAKYAWVYAAGESTKDTQNVVTGGIRFKF